MQKPASKNEVTLATLGFKEMTNSIFEDQNNLKKIRKFKIF